MKRKIVVLLMAFAAVTLSANAQKIPSDVQNDGFRGKVKKVSEYIYDAEGTAKDPQKGMSLQITETKYDNYGNKKVITYFADENNIIFKTRYKRDAIGNLILEQFINPDGDVIGRTYYSYDTKNVLTQMYVFDGETQLENRTLFVYDAQGRLIGKNLCDNYNDILDREVYELTYNGLPGKASVYNRQKQLVDETLYEYDDHDQVITATHFDYNGKDAEVSTTLYEYSYDNQGNWVERYEYIVDGDKIEPVTIIERTIEYY